MKLASPIRRLSLGILLIAAASSVLLISDWNQRQSGRGPLPRVALFQHASQPVLDEGMEGTLAALAAQGFRDGETISLQRFNAENDLPTANAIATQLASGEFDMVITASTLSMQTMANANQAGKTKHIFGVVADPFGAGVGVSRENPLEHPPQMVGVGSFIDPANAFRLAKQLYPPLKSVGLVWNTAESNSAAFTGAARAVSQELGITLLEANIDNSSGVFEAASSVVARGAQALFLSGDVTVLVAADSVIGAAQRGRIPVFSIIPPSITKGALFDYGANFYEIGFQVGELAAKVLNGADMTKIPVVNSVPPKMAVNTTALAGLKDPWVLPDDLLAKADVVLDEKGLHDKTAHAAQPAPGRTYKLGVVYFAPEEGADSCLKGLFDSLGEQGFQEGENLEVRRAHAQAEIANIPALLQNYDNQDVDMIVTLTTPCLTGACATVRKKPVVFTYVYDPIAAGAGTSRADHIAHVTGVGSFPPVDDTIELIQKLVPGVKAVGTLYNSSEANSRKVVGVARDLFKEKGIGLEEVTVTSTSEVLQAAQVLTHRGIQAMWVTGDNTAIQGFDAIARAALDAKLPLVINDPEFIGKGALAAVGLGWYEAGHSAGKLVGRVLLGANPKDIPFEEVAVKKVLLNDDIARQLGVTFPPEILKEAGR